MMEIQFIIFVWVFNIYLRENRSLLSPPSPTTTTNRLNEKHFLSYRIDIF